MSTYFITGISTNIGKTIASAIVTEALQADYWKPVQAGELDNCDTKKVERLVSNTKSKFHPNSYALQTPMSPHAAAEIDNISIDIKKIKAPKTNNHLVIEGAGGLFVPLNDTQTIFDLIKPNYKVIVVSRHYLGSINHTILSIDALKNRGIKVLGIIFNGNENAETESYILNYSGLPCLGRVKQHSEINKEMVLSYKEQFKIK